MKTSDPAENSSSPAVHSARIRSQLGDLIDHLEADRTRVDDPRFGALLEVSAEILKSMRTLFANHDETRARNIHLAQ
jgi:hypothetical protein